jgi:hypothetical protein
VKQEWCLEKSGNELNVPIVYSPSSAELTLLAD